VLEIPDWLDRALWERWCSDRSARRKPITEEGAKTQLKKLAEYRQQGLTPAEVIEHSIAGGYQGLFPPPRNVAQMMGVNKQELIEARNRAVGEQWLRRHGDADAS
jgi:hypothetical protein